jgi:transglutaminase-like putative cysteine protease
VQTHFGVPQSLGAFTGSTALLAGDAGTHQTVSLAKKLVDAAVKDPAVNALAVEIVRGTPQYDNLSKAEAIYNWVRDNILYVYDPIGPFGPKETLRPMRDLMHLRAGDCDDINMVFIPSLLGTIGYGSRVVTIKADPDNPTEFSHVYCEAKIDGEWVPMDCARPGAMFGEEPPYYWERKEWPITDDRQFSLLGYHGRQLQGYVLDGYALEGYDGLEGMGDDSTTAQDIQAASVGAAAVISAANQNPYSYLYTTNLATPGAPGLASPQLGYGASGLGVTVTSWWPIIGIAVFALAFMRFRR